MELAIALSILLGVLLVVRIPFFAVLVAYVLAGTTAFAAALALVWLGIRFPVFGVIEGMLLLVLLIVCADQLTTSRIKRAITRPYRRHRHAGAYRRAGYRPPESPPRLPGSVRAKLLLRRVVQSAMPAFSERQKVRKLVFQQDTDDLKRASLGSARPEKRRHSEAVRDYTHAANAERRRLAARQRDQVNARFARQVKKLMAGFAGFELLGYAQHGDVAVVRIPCPSDDAYIEYRIIARIQYREGFRWDASYELFCRQSGQECDKGQRYDSFRDLIHDLKNYLREALAVQMRSTQMANGPASSEPDVRSFRTT